MRSKLCAWQIAHLARHEDKIIFWSGISFLPKPFFHVSYETMVPAFFPSCAMKWKDPCTYWVFLLVIFNIFCTFYIQQLRKSSQVFLLFFKSFKKKGSAISSEKIVKTIILAYQVAESAPSICSVVPKVMTTLLALPKAVFSPKVCWSATWSQPLCSTTVSTTHLGRMHFPEEVFPPFLPCFNDYRYLLAYFHWLERQIYSLFTHLWDAKNTVKTYCSILMLFFELSVYSHDFPFPFLFSVCG